MQQLAMPVQACISLEKTFGNCKWADPLKAPYSSKIDILIQERFNKLIYSINTIIKCGIWQPVKNSVNLYFWNWIKMKQIFYHISELMLASLIQSKDKNHFISRTWLNEILQAVRCHILWLY